MPLITGVFSLYIQIHTDQNENGQEWQNEPLHE